MKSNNIIRCEFCNKPLKGNSSEITLYGTEDIYKLTVCSSCNNKLNDYFEPETVDEMIGGI